jgi:hypothetical protein
MAFQHQAVATNATPANGLRDSLASLVSKLRAALDAGANAYAAATIYQQLSRLSDAELGRRGLSRASLARDMLAAHERGASGL